MPTHRWDTIAESAKWARAHEHILIDSHWIGGSPASFQTYGFASYHV